MSDYKPDERDEQIMRRLAEQNGGPSYHIYQQYSQRRVQVLGLGWPLNLSQVKMRVSDYQHNSTRIGIGDTRLGFTDGQQALTFWRKVLSDMESA